MEKLYLLLGLFILCTGYTSLPAQEDPNLFLYFPFDGKVEDEMGNLKNEKLVGGIPVEDRLGVEGGAYKFPTRKEYFEADFVRPLCTENGVSMSAWVKVNSFLGDRRFFNIENRDSFIYNCRSRISAHYASGMFCFGGYSKYRGVCPWDTNRSIQDTSWYHVAGTFSRDFEAKVYVNGELKRTLSNKSTPFYFHDLDRISVNSYGNLDELKIYERLLTDCEILALYNDLDPREECPEAQTMECVPPDPLPTMIYPNPTKDYIRIHVEGRPNEYLIPWSLYNTAGQRVAGGITNCNDYRIDLQDYPAGIYFIKFDDQFHKIVKTNQL